MLRIRLMRFGRRNDPRYRIVVIPQRSKPQGKYIEAVGHYDPRKDIAALKKDRIQFWLEHGARVSDTVHNILVKHGVLPGPKHKKHHILQKMAVTAIPGSENSTAFAPKERSS